MEASVLFFYSEKERSWYANYHIFLFRIRYIVIDRESHTTLCQFDTLFGKFDRGYNVN